MHTPIEVALTHGGHAKARVWLDEVPSLPMPTEATAVEGMGEASSTSAMAGPMRRVAVELHVPGAGGPATALLVASSRPLDRLRVRVSSTDEDGEPIAWVLVDDVRAGLPGDLATAVVGGAVAEADRIGVRGLIAFEAAARGPTSTPGLFSRCAKLVARLLVGPRSGLTPENLVSILRGTWQLDVERPTFYGLNEATASFRVFGPDVDPVDVTALLGMEPSSSRRRGQELSSTTPEGERVPRGVAREGGWVLDSACPRLLTLEEHLHALLDRLEPHTDVIAALRRQGFRVDLYCGYFQRSGQGGPTFSPAVLSRLSRLGVELGVDIFP